jgi:hypothetical protein
MQQGNMVNFHIGLWIIINNLVKKNYMYMYINYVQIGQNQVWNNEI